MSINISNKVLGLQKALRPTLGAIVVFYVNSIYASTTLDEVVVTVNQQQKSQIDAPLQVQSIDAEIIRSAGPQVNLSESLIRVPGITILNRQNYAQDLQLSIRGFGARTAFGIRGVRILVDGIPATMPDGQGQASTISLSSAGRIDVLRGPLAQLHGNAAGGVIQAFTRQAPHNPELSFRTSQGSFNSSQTGLQYGAQIDRLGVVADYNEFQTEGARQNSAAKRRHFNSRVAWGDHTTSFALVANLFEMPLALDPGGLDETWKTNSKDARQAFVIHRARKTVEQHQVGLVSTHRAANSVDINSRLYLGTRDVFQAQSGATWIGTDRTFHGVGVAVSQPIHLGSLAARWTAGIDWDRADEDRTGGTTGDGVPAGEKTPRVSTRQQGYVTGNRDVYAHVELFPSERWSLTAGARLSKGSMDVTDHLSPSASGAVTHTVANPVAGISWHLNPLTTVYANIGKGFETPTIAETSYSGTDRLDRFNSQLKPSRSVHREVGVKTGFWPSSRLEVALYDINTQDEIVVLSSNDGKTSYTNAAQTRRRGAEVALTVVPYPSWRFTTALNQISAEYSRSFQSGTTLIAAGNTIPGVPTAYRFAEIAWSTLAWRLEADGLRKSQAATTAALEWISADTVFANDRNDRYADGYEIANARFSHDIPLAMGTLSVLARVDNLLNRKHIGSVIVGNAYPFEPAAPRNGFLGLRYTLKLN